MMSGAEIIGLISGIIAIVDAVSKVYTDIRDAQGLPQDFREAARKLPLVRNVLQTTERRLRACKPDTDSLEATKPTVEDCKNKIERLESIFRKVIPQTEGKSSSRYVIAMRALGKGDQVGCLMKGILEDVQLLAGDHGIKAATETQVGEVIRAIEDLSTMPVSTPAETPIGVHYGSGDQYTYRGVGDQNINTGPGSQFIGHTQHFGSSF
jgi:hypothetical protein